MAPRILIIIIGAFLPWPVCFLNAQSDLQTQFNKGFHDQGNSIIQTTEASYVILGGSTPSRSLSEEDFLLVKTNTSGDELWMKTYGGAEREVGFDIVEARDGGYLLIGYTESFGAGEADIYLVKTDQNGNLLWQKTFGGTGVDRGIAIIKNEAGGYAFTGTMEMANGSRDLIIAAVDESGNLLWQKSYGGNNIEEGRNLIQTFDGGFLVCGSTWNFGQGEDDVYLIKTDAHGNLQWTRNYGGSGVDGATAVRQTHDGGYIVSGYSSSFGAPGYGIYLLKLDPSGESLWTRRYHGSADDILIHDDGAYLSVGHSRSYDSAVGTKRDAYILKTSPGGDSLWSRKFTDTNNTFGNGFCRSHDGAYLITGRSSSRVYDRGWPDDVLLIKTYVPTDPKLKDILKPGLFPNPNRGSFQVNSSAPLKRIEISDAMGRIIYTIDQPAFSSRLSTPVNLPAFRPGVYFAHIYSHRDYHCEAFVLH